uniref:Protein amnionless n=1 Tax=Setaria digitata TaxID=48799 RepID=A0A915Q7N2_9BILA
MHFHCQYGITIRTRKLQMQGVLRNISTLFLLLHVQCLTYIFRRTNVLEEKEYWEEKIIPCGNDYIQFDEEKITTILIASDLHSQTIDLPKNGILFFSEKMELGKLGNWQCKKRQNAKEVYFKQNPSLGFYNGSNWVISKKAKLWRPALHALQVPSSEDTAIIPTNSGARVLIENFITVGELILAGRKLVVKEDGRVMKCLYDTS